MSRYSNNIDYIVQHLLQFLINIFPNAGENNIKKFTQLLFDNYNSDLDYFNNIVRDFLIQLNEYDAQTISELYSHEKLLLQQKREKVLIICFFRMKTIKDLLFLG